MLSKVPVDEIVMHYFEKMLSASGGFVPQAPTWTPLETFVRQTPSLPTPGKNPAVAHVQLGSPGERCELP